MHQSPYFPEGDEDNSHAGWRFRNTVYARVFERPDSSDGHGSVVIKYFCFYPFNDWQNNHEGDWQRINVIVTSREPDVAEFYGIDYMFHGKSITYYAVTDSLSSINIRQRISPVRGRYPVAYVSAGGHGHYPTPGNYASAGEVTYDDDLTSHGLVLHPKIVDSSTDIAQSYDLVLLCEPETSNAENMGLDPEMSWLGADIAWGELKVPSPGSWVPYAADGNDPAQGPFYKGWNGIRVNSDDKYSKSKIPYTSFHNFPIVGDVTWSGMVSLRGDIVVFPGATLTIEPGTVIEFEPRTDIHKFPAQGHGVDNRAEIFVYGTLNAEGTSTSLIRFRRKSGTPAQAGYDWGGIRIMEGGSVDLDYTTIRNTPPPPPPTGLTAQAGTGQATLRWDAHPVDAGITEWQYRLKPEGVGWRDWQTMPNSEPLTAEHMVTGLIDGETSTFLVRAVNTTGAGSASAAVSVDIPLSPSLVKPTHTPTLTARAGDGEVTLSWDEPNATQCTWQYQQTRALGILAEWENIPDSRTFTTEYTVGDLTNGLTYVFKVRAVNDYGQGPASAAVSVMPIAGGHRVPLQPTGLSVEGPITRPSTRPGQLYVSWAAVSATPAVNGYTLRYQSKPDLGVAISSWSDWCILPDDIAAGTISYTHTRLSGKTLYRYQVRATNAQGNGAWSAAFPEAGQKPNSPPESPARRPSEPQNLMAAAANESVTLTWQAPANNGGATITDYKYRYRATESTRWSPSAEGVPLGQTTRSTVVENLTNGTPYTFQVWAVNRAGNGTSASVESTPGVVPPVPTDELSATAGLNQITVGWGEVSATPEVTGYELQYRSAVVGTDDWSDYLPATTTGPRKLSYTHREYGTVSVKYRFQYQVKALNDIGESAWSDSFPVEGAIPLPGHTTALDSMGVDNQNVTVRWECPNYKWCEPLDGASVAPLTLQSRMQSGSGPWTGWVGVTSSQKTTVTHSVSSLDQALVHRFQTQAVNANGGLGFGSEWAVVVPLRAQAGAGTVRLGWDAPGRIIDAWQYRLKSGSGSWGAWQEVPDSDRITTSHAVSSLTNGVSYQFQVRATYRGKVKVLSFIQSATPQGRLSLTASRGDGQVALSWTAPANSPTISDYQVQWRVANSGHGWPGWSTVPGGSMASDTTATGLTNGAPYLFQVQAIDSEGAVVAVSNLASATPAGRPGAPGNLSASPGDGQVALSWTAAAANGSAIHRYEYRRTDSTSSDGWTGWMPAGDHAVRSTIAPGLTNGTSYTFEVRALNDVGAGSSASASATPQAGTLLLTASRGDGQVALSWTAPANSPTIANYQVRWRVANSGHGWPGWSTVSGGSMASDTTATGLTNGTKYEFAAQAIDSQDASVVVSNLVSVTPAGRPSAPGNLLASPGDGQVALSWTAAAANGSAIHRYEYRRTDSTSSDGWTGWMPAGDHAVRSTIAPGLTNGTSYTFEVRALNDVGAGSSASASATPNPHGVVSLSSYSPQEDTQLTAELTDPSGGISGTTWQWQRRSSPTASWTSAAGTSSQPQPWISTYIPQSGDVGDQLRATVSYTDADGPDQSAQSSATDAVQAAPSVAAPTFANPTDSFSVEQGATKQITLDAASGTGITYTLVEAPSWIVPLPGSARVYTLQPSSTQAAVPYNFTWRATNAGGSASQTITITVTAPTTTPDPGDQRGPYYRLATSRPTTPAANTTGGRPSGWSTTRLSATSTQGVWSTTATRSSGSSIYSYSVPSQIEAPDPGDQRGPYYRLATSRPTTPAANTTGGVPTGWSTSRPSATSTQGVWSTTATRSSGSSLYSYSVPTQIEVPRPVTAPGSLSSLSAESGSVTSSISVSIGAPTTGTPPFSYEVQYRLDQSGTSWSSGSTSITGLLSGQNYRIRARATNSGGNGPWSYTSATAY